jgi:ribosomal protein S18 acetylase RimI-like enzyme
MSVTIDDLEAAAAQGWRAPEEERLGEWRLRAAGGFTGRANSALAVGDPGLPLAEAVSQVRRWYAARNLPAMISVPYPLGRPGDSPTDRFLDEQGWHIRSGPAVVMTARAAEVARGTQPGEVTQAGERARAGEVTRGPGRVDLQPEPGQAWLDMYHYRGRALPPVARQVLLSAPFQAFASIRRQGGTVAIGRVAVADGWGGLTAIEVHPDQRRTGLATAITAALAAVAADHGAAGLYLQVEQDNQAARALYARTGFTGHHGYHYRVAPADGGPAPMAAGGHPITLREPRPSPA